MQLVKDRLLKDAMVLNDRVIKVDGFLNHQVDTELVMKAGEAIAAHYKNYGVTRVLTAEAAGLPIGMATAHHLGVPMVYAKRGKAGSGISSMPEDAYAATYHSFTRGQEFPIAVSKKYLKSDDCVLVVDDILANGNCLLALKNVIDQAGAKLVGTGFFLEKSFQNGRKILTEQGIEVFSLAPIKMMAPPNTIVFSDDE